MLGKGDLNTWKGLRRVRGYKILYYSECKYSVDGEGEANVMAWLFGWLVEWKKVQKRICVLVCKYLLLCMYVGKHFGG